MRKQNPWAGGLDGLHPMVVPGRFSGTNFGLKAGVRIKLFQPSKTGTVFAERAWMPKSELK